MKRSEVNKYLNKDVELTLFDRKVIKGILKEGYHLGPVIKNGWYYIDVHHFRASHIITIKEI